MSQTQNRLSKVKISKDYIWNCMALQMLLINTLSYGCACMSLIVIEAFTWLLNKGFFVNNE